MPPTRTDGTATHADGHANLLFQAHLPPANGDFATASSDGDLRTATQVTATLHLHMILSDFILPSWLLFATARYALMHL
jgi:hypothetical protein